uniref:Uncharacterized protein n=1 Tax=Anopheles farauti TaxID=69004 RepID=A0A182QRU4_9DIPT
MEVKSWRFGSTDARYHIQTDASVHKPRQISNVAAIKRTAGQAAASDGRDMPMVVFERVSKCIPNSKAVTVTVRSSVPAQQQQPPAYTSDRVGCTVGVGGENNGRIFNQPTLPLPVQIPNPFARTASPAMLPVGSTNYGAHPLQQQHQKQQQQQQLQPNSLSQKTDYLQPSGGIRQGVNQKSLPPADGSDGCRRAATGVRFTKHQSTLPCPVVPPSNLITPKQLNDIYEKHLLSQTTFEVGTPVGLTSTGPAQHNPPGKHATETTRTLTKSDTRLRATVGKASGKDQTVQPLYNTATEPTEHNLYESVRSNYHIYEKIDSRRSSLAGTGPCSSLVASSTSSLEQYERPVAPLQVGPASTQQPSPPPPLHPRPKSHPAGGIDQQHSAAPANGDQIAQISTARPANLHELQKSIQFKLPGSSLSPIQERPPLPPVTGASRMQLPQRSASTRSERVNIALETAKAIATAAYIER